MANLTVGIRLVLVLPTIFFLISQVLKYRLKTKSEKETNPQMPIAPTSILSWMGQRANVAFRWEFFIDSTILSMANGLILVFELSRTEYGIVLLISGIFISLAGLVETYCNSDEGVTIVSLLLYTLFLSEMFYFSAFGISYVLFGLTVLPKSIFLVPWLALVIFVVLASIFAKPQQSMKAT